MIMNNQTWQLVKNSNKISGFTGNDHKPIPLSQNEAIKMVYKFVVKLWFYKLLIPKCMDFRKIRKINEILGFGPSVS